MCFSLIRSYMIRLTNQCHVSYVFEILDFSQNVFLFSMGLANCNHCHL